MKVLNSVLAVSFGLMLIGVGVCGAESTKNLLQNGSFEQGPEPGSYKVMKKGEMIPGWQITKNTVDYIGTYFPSANGKRHFDMDGTPGFGAIKQSFKTESGQRYKLTFSMAGNPQGAPQVKRLKVMVDGQMKEFTHPASADWSQKTMTFTGKGDSSIEFMSANTTGDSWGALLDNVRIEKVGMKN